MKHVWHDLLDWLDRNADMTALVAVLVAAFFTVAMCAGTPDDGRGYLQNATTDRSPSVVVGTVPGSPVSHGGVEPGATDEGGAG